MRDWLHHLLLPSRAANRQGSIHRWTASAVSAGVVLKQMLASGASV